MKRPTNRLIAGILLVCFTVTSKPEVAVGSSFLNAPANLPKDSDIRSTNPVRPDRDKYLLQIYLGQSKEHWWAEHGIVASGIDLSPSSIRLQSHALTDFAESLNSAARNFGVIVLSPSHSNQIALYWLKVATVDDVEKITRDDLMSLKGKVDLRNVIIILDACKNVELAPAFIELGAKAVYAHTVPDYQVNFYAVFQHMKSGIPLPNGLSYVTKESLVKNNLEIGL